MPINRVRLPWQGIPSGPGVTTIYLGSGSTNMSPLVSFLNAINTLIPTGINVTVPNIGDIINETDGKIIGSWTGVSGTSVNGLAAAAPYAAQSGACIDWLSSLVLDGRRRQGRSFLVPLASAAFQNDGTIGTTSKTQLENAGAGLIAAYAGELKVFVRPLAARAAKPDNIPPITAKTGHVGAAAQVIACKVPDFAATLRSRRL